MTTVSMFVCPSGAQFTDTDSAGNQIAGCATGQGAWQQVVIQDPFNVAQLNTSELAAFWFAGAVVCGTGLAIAWAGAVLARSIKEI